MVSPTMKLFSSAISRIARMRYWRIESWMEHPIEVQQEVLYELLSHGQYTLFGMEHGYTREMDEQAFKAATPISEYNDLKPYIDRIIHGEENVLWNTPVTWFAKSSGTSGDKSKFIPITEESLEQCHYQAAKDVLTIYYNNFPESNLLTGKGLVIGGSHQVSQLNEEIFYGDLSAVLMQNTPFWGEWLRTPELSIALMDEWENKIEAIARSTIQEDVTSISGVPTWTLILFRRILEITGKKSMVEVWPNLELYMHGGVSFVPYQKRFEDIIGKKINYLDIYNASEGFFAAQSDIEEDGMLLFLQHGIYYEFMPVEEYHKPRPRTVGLQEVELGKNYALIISTNGGLWRYMPGDTVQFTSIFPFKIKVSGRIKSYINAFGEEVIVDNADQAIAEACRQTGAVVNEYTAAPVYFGDDSNGAHEWLIEFAIEPASLEKFTEVLDHKLQSINSDYEAKRYHSIALHLPEIHSVPTGTFARWMRSQGRFGGQNKVPRLSNERNYVEQIKTLASQNLPTIS